MVRFIFTCLLVLLSWQAALAQGPAEAPSPKATAIEPRYLLADEMPHLPGGTPDAASIEASLRAQLRYQPPAGQPPFGPDDTALLCFTIGADGRVREARVLSKLEPGFGRAVLAAAGRLPRFVPGRLEGQAVAVRYTLIVGAAGPHAGNARIRQGNTVLPPTWPGVEKHPRAAPSLPGNVSLRTALAQRLVYPVPNNSDRAHEVALAFTVDTLGHPTDVLIERSGGLAHDRAVLAALAALPPFMPYRHLRRAVAARQEVTIDFPPRPAGYQPVVSSQLPADPPVNSPAIHPALDAEQRPAAERGGLYYIMSLAQYYVVLPEEVRTGVVDGLVVVEAVAGLSGRVYGLRIQQSLSPACDSAALAAVRRLPLLTPGQYRGQTTALRMYLPLKFWGPNHLYEPNTVPHPPAFAQGDLDAYIKANLRVPDSLTKAELNRYVDVLLTLGRDGQVQEARLLNNSQQPALDAEALRLVHAMPPWLPARDADNHPVRSQVRLLLPFSSPPTAKSPPAPTPPAAAEKKVVEETIYTYVEQMPELPGGGGLAAIKAAVQARFRYPQATDVIAEVITVSFVVSTSGQVETPRIVKGGWTPAVDAAVLAAVRALPRFVPGRQNGRLVAVSYTIPVTTVQR